MARPNNFRRMVIFSGAGIAIVLIVAALATDWSTHRTRLIQEAVGWRIGGAPCKSVSAQDFASVVDALAPTSYTGLKVDFDDIRMSWSSGKSSCKDIMVEGSMMLDTFPVCQFAHPRKLKVTLPTGDLYFLTGDRPVTVSAADGKVKCVLNSTLFKR